MKKKEIHIQPEELSAFLDKDLESGRLVEIENHLRECGACSDIADDLGTLCSRLSDFSESQPERDLWANIASRLETKPVVEEAPWWQKFWMMPVAAAAGAMAVVVFVIVFGGGVGIQKDNQPAGPVDALDAVARAEAEYLNAIDSLEKTLAEGKDRMNPETHRVATHGLAEINKAIEKYRAELGENPADMETRESMLAVYQQKVDFMSDLVADTLVE